MYPPGVQVGSNLACITNPFIIGFSQNSFEAKKRLFKKSTSRERKECSG